MVHGLSRITEACPLSGMVNVCSLAEPTPTPRRTDSASCNQAAGAHPSAVQQGMGLLCARPQPAAAPEQQQGSVGCQGEPQAAVQVLGGDAPVQEE
jgi:hypothetical protein